MKNRHVIEEMYYSYLDKKKSAKDTIIQNENRIKEIEIFLASVNETDTDIKIFSPFDTDSIFDGKVELEKAQKEKLIEENHVQVELIKDLDVRINQFKEMLDDSEEDDVQDIKEDEDDKTINFSQDDMESSLINIQEQERLRISSELHDSTVQNLVHLEHQIELASMFISQDPNRAKLELESCTQNIKTTVEEIRKIIFDLRPMSFDDLEFRKALEDYISNLQIQYPNIRFETQLDDVIAEDGLLLSLFRIIQEGVNNSIKHSESDKLLLHVKQQDGIIFVKIEDMGKGFSVDDIDDNKHFGLSIMKERIRILNGSISIDSEVGKGTKIDISVKC